MKKGLKTPKTVLITGASAGLGRALAAEFMAAGYEVLAAGRNGEALASLGAAAWYAIDLSAPNGAAELVEKVHKSGKTVDILVCNAGMGLAGPFLDAGLADLDALTAVNVTALTGLLRLALPDMRERGSGGVLVVCSTGSWQPGPYMAAYYASKAYALSLTRALRSELRGSGVTVTAVCPGAVATEFSRRAGRRDPKNAMAPEKVARAAVSGFLKGKALVVPGFVNKCGHLAAKLLPSGLMAKGVGEYQKRLLKGR